VWPAGVAINPATAEVFTIDSVSNSLFTFTTPELFRKPSTTSTLQRR
jgi:DNA-binding beta-propeller fold protein YncE